MCCTRVCVAQWVENRTHADLYMLRVPVPLPVANTLCPRQGTLSQLPLSIQIFLHVHVYVYVHLLVHLILIFISIFIISISNLAMLVVILALALSRRCP